MLTGNTLFMVYKDITYFPMTYYDCRFLGLTTDWDGETMTLSINKENISGMYREYASDTKNNKKQTAEVCGFNIVVNGKPVNNSAEEYPLLTFRGVTYFPLTWRFARDEFGWDYSFGESGLAIDSDNYHTEIIELPDYEGQSVGYDGKFYYYQVGTDIVRVAADNFSDRTVIGEWHGYIPMEFHEENGVIYADSSSGYSPMHAQYFHFKITPDGQMITTDEARMEHLLWTNVKYAGLKTANVNLLTYGNVDRINHGSLIYSYKGQKTELNFEWLSLGQYRLDGRVGFSSLDAVGEKLYVTGADIYAEGEPDSRLYCVNMETGELTTVMESVGVFHAYMTPEGEALAFARGGRLYRYDFESGITHELGEYADPIVEIFGGERLAVLTRPDGGKNTVAVYDGYGLGGILDVYRSEDTSSYSHKGDLVYESEYLFDTRGENPDSGIRLKVFTRDMKYRPYFTADYLYNKISAQPIFLHEEEDRAILLYSVEGKLVRVVLAP